VLYWQDGQLVLHNYALGCAIPAQPLLIQVLEWFREWRPLEHYLESISNGTREATAALLLAMARDRWLQSRDDPMTAREQAVDEWTDWNPAAGFFHSVTKDTRFLSIEELEHELQEQAKVWAMPSATKQYEGAPQVALPRAPASNDGTFPAVLRERRTWRRFGGAPLDFASLSTLLDLSLGVQSWVTAEGEGRVPLKTSPSGGARHPIEAYVVARNVTSLTPGVYHYAADRHILEQLVTDDVPPLDTFLPMQWWYRNAAALVLFSAVFERTRWRYHSPRAYRAVLLEAGHVCQTFCLTATWLGLAPFCSMALADSAIEQLLGLDGFSESIVYAAGVGTRPTDLDNAHPGAFPDDPSINTRRD